MTTNDDIKGLIDKNVLKLRDEPAGTIYTPPDGDPLTKEGLYLPDDPSSQTDRLINTERKYLIPLAWHMAPIFRVHPITDDIYRQTPQQVRAERLSLVISRSDIKQVDSNVLEWPAIRVIVKQYDVVRVVIRRDFSRDICEIRRLWLWSNSEGDYSSVEDPDGGDIDLQTMLEILAKYAALEGILRGAPIGPVPAVQG